ncbi:MAG: GNAT family N-acetyltransferase [Acidimicrobiales bacterium]
MTSPLVLQGRRVSIRTLSESDYDAWHEIRTRCRGWLLPWEPRAAGASPPSEDRASFASRCALRERERQAGSGYGFGIFIGEALVGEITLSSVQRGPFQSASIGYWIDQAWAGQGIMPESVVVALRFAFEALGLHRVEISIIPRNSASRRVPEKLGIRLEGVSARYLEINGVWEDHVRYAITIEEWARRGAELVESWTAAPS